MATRNIVPRATGEGSIGTPAKHWGDGQFDVLHLGGGDVGSYLAESTGYGIISGCAPTISGLTVTVAAGVVHLADGTRKEIASTNITLDAADASNPRIDLVYITSAGVVAKTTGTASATPSAPTLPSQGISVCTVSVAANASTGTLVNTQKLSAWQKPKFKRPFRLLFVSDIHLCIQNWYGVSTSGRLQKFVNDVNAECRKSPVDAIIGLGDYSLDYWMNGGSLDDGVSNTRNFIEYYAGRICQSIFLAPGNHEGGYTNTAWKEMTGMGRNFTIVNDDANVAVIFLDTYANTPENAYNTDGTYTNVDVDYLQKQIEICKDKMIILAAHFFNLTSESNAFKDIIKNTDNILCLIQGHTHKSAVVSLGSDYGNKYLLQSGNFSYSGESTPSDSMWGFREILLTESGVKSSYIVPSYSVTINNSIVSDTYHKQDEITFDYQIPYNFTASNIVNDVKNFKNIDDCYTLAYTKATISPNDDLNNYTDCGVYMCSSLDVTRTIINCPVNAMSGFKLVVERATGDMGNNSNVVYQTVIPYSTLQGQFIRHYNFSTETWEAWVQIGGVYSGNDNADILTDEKYVYVDGASPGSMTFDYNSAKGGAWDIVAAISESGSIIALKKLIAFEPYTNTGSLKVYELFSNTTSAQNLNYSISGNTVTFTSVYGCRIYAKRMTKI